MTSLDDRHSSRTALREYLHAMEECSSSSANVLTPSLRSLTLRRREQQSQNNTSMASTMTLPPLLDSSSSSASRYDTSDPMQVLQAALADVEQTVSLFENRHEQDRSSSSSDQSRRVALWSQSTDWSVTDPDRIPSSQAYASRTSTTTSGSAPPASCHVISMLPRARIAFLPTVSTQEAAAAASKDNNMTVLSEDDDCVICCEGLVHTTTTTTIAESSNDTNNNKSRTAMVTRLPCGHVYHFHCICSWLSKTNTCPECRYELPTDNVQYEKRRMRKYRHPDNQKPIQSCHCTSGDHKCFVMSRVGLTKN